MVKTVVEHLNELKYCNELCDLVKFDETDKSQLINTNAYAHRWCPKCFVLPRTK